ncbi:MAG: cytochrome c553 [Polaromonas sp.]|jgi:cytochrome c553
MIKNVLSILLMSAAITGFAEDLSPGAAKAATACALCHGANGLATLPNAPNLAGQQAFYLTEQLNNYRSGKRQHEVMGYVAKNLTDVEITQLAAWYSSIKITVEVP